MESPISKSCINDFTFKQMIKEAKALQVKNTLDKIGEFNGSRQQDILERVLENTSGLRVRNKFKALKIAYQAGKTGGSATVCLNAANEEAVFAFLQGKIKLFDIISTVEAMMEKHNVIKNPSIEEIFSIDEYIRARSRELFVHI